MTESKTKAKPKPKAKPRFTPGPWWIDRGLSFGSIWIRGPRYASAVGKDDHVASVSKTRTETKKDDGLWGARRTTFIQHDRPNAEGDALLIAAAPTMYCALEAIAAGKGDPVLHAKKALAIAHGKKVDD